MSTAAGTAGTSPGQNILTGLVHVVGQRVRPAYSIGNRSGKRFTSSTTM